MRGLVVERARTSNCIDIWPLLKLAVNAGVFPGEKPTERALQDYYFNLLTRDLPNEANFYYLAKRGRGFLGVLRAVLLPGRWDGSTTTFFIDFIYVIEKRQKMGVGRKLIDQLVKDAGSMGLKNFEFLCPDSQLPYWERERKAVKVSNLMRVTDGL